MGRHTFIQVHVSVSVLQYGCFSIWGKLLHVVHTVVHRRRVRQLCPFVRYWIMDSHIIQYRCIKAVIKTSSIFLPKCIDFIVFVYVFCEWLIGCDVTAGGGCHKQLPISNKKSISSDSINAISVADSIFCRKPVQKYRNACSHNAHYLIPNKLLFDRKVVHCDSVSKLVFLHLSSSLGVVAFHGLQLKIKRELHSPCSELSSNCSQERPFKLQYGEKCPYNVRWAPHNTDWTL